MIPQIKSRLIIVVSGVTFALLSSGYVPTLARSQDRGSSNALPRTFDGKPDLNGIWQALNMANWDLLDHASRQGPIALGAFFSIPGGQGVVEGNEIPYRPEAVAKKKQNAEKWLTLDPE